MYALYNNIYLSSGLIFDEKKERERKQKSEDSMLFYTKATQKA